MKKQPTKCGIRFFIILTFFIWLFAACGCGGGGNTGNVKSFSNTTNNTGGTTGETQAAASLAVTLVDEADAPVSGVTVTVDGGEQYTSDSAGRVTVPVAQVADGGTPVLLATNRGGYVPLHQTVRVHSWALSDGVMEATIMLPREPGTAEAGTQAQIVDSTGNPTLISPEVTTDAASGLPVAKTTVNVTEDMRSVIFSAASWEGAPPPVSLSVGDATGAGANAAAVLGLTGDVTGSIAYGDPTDPDALAMFPGEFLTTDDTGGGAGEGVLITAGFARITLTDSAGRPITNFAGGAAVTVTMRVPSDVINPETGATVAVGDSIPVFSFNETTGEWIVEHESGGGVKRAVVQQDDEGLFVTFDISHLTWLNLDWKQEQCPDGSPRVDFVDENGAPVTGVRFYAWVPGWRNNATYAQDSFVQFTSAPADMPIYVYAKKDGYISQTVELLNCSDATINIKTCPDSCMYSRDCNDDNPNTLDYCSYSIGACSSCSNHTCNIYCRSDSECDDGNSNTLDTCRSAGTCYARCDHASCTSTCSTNADCDDGNPLTVNTCYYNGCANVCNSYYCSVACSYDVECEDDNELTTDTCENPDTCDAQCVNRLSCAACAMDSECNDDNAATLDWCSNAGTCDAACEHCTPACVSDAECDDGNPETQDTCNTSAGCSATCENTLTCSVPCSQDSDCNDGHYDTRDTCINSGTCAAACSNEPCTVACLNHAACDDGNSFTSDECVNPSTCDAACTNTACTAACSADAECDDGNPATTDVCYNAGTCAASCGAPTSGLSVSVGVQFACALRVDGTAQCWGNGEACDLGDGNCANSAVPVNVMNVTAGAHIAAGAVHACALQTDDSVWCWGFNMSNQCGVPSSIPYWLFEPENAFTLSGAAALEGGSNHTCALMDNGTMKCWGGDYGSDTPVDVAGISGATALAAGDSYDCALINDGTVQCWGYNTYGQLGNGTYASSTVPVPVTGLSDAVDIDTSHQTLGLDATAHTCAALSGGGVQCWGGNSFGQLGDGSYATSTVPVSVSGVSTAVGVCTGNTHSCALLADGTAMCWGGNSQGELGNGTTTSSNTPVAVSGLTGAADISCGYSMSCALMIGGGIKCWGNYDFGHLGDGDTLQGSLTPVDVIGF